MYAAASQHNITQSDDAFLDALPAAVITYDRAGLQHEKPVSTKMPICELNGAQLDDVFLDCLPATAFAACP